MANREQLARLEKSVKEWNEWRLENPLVKVDLSDANLSDADLYMAHLFNTDLSRANLSNANLIGVNLDNTNLISVNLRNAKLSNANLRNAKLSDADLRSADLRQIQALRTNFEGATLTGACIQDWHINSETNLNNIICEYVYLRYDLGLYTERRPSNPTKIFAPRDFARLFQKLHETADLIFQEGIDWQAFSNSFQGLQIECESEVSIQAIEQKPDGSFVVRMKVSKDADKAEIEGLFQEKYDAELKRLEGVYQERLLFKDEQIEFYKQQNENMTEIFKLQAMQKIQYINTSEAKIVSHQSQNPTTYNQRDMAIGHMNGHIQDHATVAHTINEAQSQNLASAAKEIQDLLEQLLKTYPTTTTSEQMAVAMKTIEQIESNPTLKERAIGAAKEGLMGGLKLVPGGSIVVGVIEGWTSAKPKS